MLKQQQTSCCSWWLGLVLVIALPTNVLSGDDIGDSEVTLAPPAPATYDSFNQYTRFLELLMQHYVAPDRLQQLNTHTVAALRAFLQSLDAEADLFIPGEDHRQQTAMPHARDQSTVPFGAVLSVAQGHPVVVSAVDGSTAQQLGLLAGEQLVALNAESLAGMRIHEVYRLLDGPPDSEFILKVLDPAHGTRSVLVKRNKDQSAPASVLHRLHDHFVYLRIPSFTFSTAEMLHQFVEEIRGQPIRGAILDLRNNPGGELNATVVATSLFIPIQKTIVSLVHARESREAILVSSNPRPLDLRLVILVNQGTANEAEIFAAALRHHQAAQIVGTDTYGRSRVFSTFSLPDGSHLRFPTAYYRSPSGARLDHGGLTPDVMVPLPRETERALAGLGYGSFDWKRHRAQILQADQQLARAVELLEH